jgi:predicted MFS family arabinose efflux permease
MNWPLTIIIATCVQSVLVIQLFVEDTARRFSLDEDWLGVLASAETGMAALISLFVFLKPSMVSRSLLLFSGAMLFAGNAACAFVQTPEQLLIARAVMGGSAGLICSWAYREVLNSNDSARAQGIALMLQSFLLVVSFAVVPHLAELIESPLYWVNGGWFLLMLVALFRVQVSALQPVSSSTSQTSFAPLPALLFFVGVVTMYASHGAFDTFIAELGSQSGVALTDIGYAMMAACAIGIPAGAMASAIGARLGVLRPILVAVISMLAAMVVLALADMQVAIFWLVAVAYNFGWVLALPFIVLAAEALTDGGRMASGLLMMQALGMATGAIISGDLAADIGINLALVGIVPVALLLSVVAFALLNRRVAVRVEIYPDG